SSVATWALFSKQGITLRSLILFNSFCWVSHNLWLGSIGGSLVESTFIVTNLFTIYRLFHAQERLSQTQNNQFLASNTESSTD
ncbi:YgjV family protein, partial [Vibrio parahaemolyticus]